MEAYLSILIFGRSKVAIVSPQWMNFKYHFELAQSPRTLIELCFWYYGDGFLPINTSAGTSIRLKICHPWSPMSPIDVPVFQKFQLIVASNPYLCLESSSLRYIVLK